MIHLGIKELLRNISRMKSIAYIDSEEEESDDSYDIIDELLTDDEELIAIRDKVKEARNMNKKKDDDV